MNHRRKIIIGNWKMNSRLTAGLSLARALADKAEKRKPMPCDIVICPPATIIWPVAEAIIGSPVMIGGQNCHTANHGAYTGEISAGMLADLGCHYVILGHSERRMGQGESNSTIAAKVEAAQLAGLNTIVCVGETKQQHDEGTTLDVVMTQVRESLPEKWAPAQLIIAYEPVWAIGTGEQARVEDVCTIHRTIRAVLGDAGVVVPIIYGGSVTPGNAAAILSEPEIDGVLVGAASLNSDGFWAIAEKCEQS